MDPAIARFIATHHRSARQSAEDDVADVLDKSPAETWPDIVAVCQAAAWALAGRPDRDELVAEVDPPHPSYPGIIRRLRLSR